MINFETYVLLSIIMDCYHLLSVIIDPSVTHSLTNSRIPSVTRKKRSVWCRQWNGKNY